MNEQYVSLYSEALNHTSQNTWPQKVKEIALYSRVLGMGYPEITRRLGEAGFKVTRNAVIGAVHRMERRLGLQPQGKRPRRTEDRPARKRTPRLLARTEPARQRGERLAPSQAQAIYVHPAPQSPPAPILLRKEGQCPAIVDDSVWGMASMCGAPVRHGCYCEFHGSIFYRKDAKKRYCKPYSMPLAFSREREHA